MVVVLGHDLFATQFAPVGAFDRLSDDFNAPLLMLLLVIVCVAVVVVRHLSIRKQLLTEWA